MERIVSWKNDSIESIEMDSFRCIERICLPWRLKLFGSGSRRRSGWVSYRSGFIGIIIWNRLCHSYCCDSSGRQIDNQWVSQHWSMCQQTQRWEPLFQPSTKPILFTPKGSSTSIIPLSLNVHTFSNHFNIVPLWPVPRFGLKVALHMLTPFTTSPSEPPSWPMHQFAAVLLLPVGIQPCIQVISLIIILLLFHKDTQ